MTDPILTPTTRAVLQAIAEISPAPADKIAAAALRAVAEHCVPDDSEGHWVYIPLVLDIANELENNS